MSNHLHTDLILNKIIIFNKYILNYFEERLMTLSPAGKFQIFLLSSSIVVQRLKVIDTFQSNNIDTKLFRERLLIMTHSIFEEFKKEYYDVNTLYNHSNFFAKTKINSQNRVVFKKNKSTLENDSLKLMLIFSLEIDSKVSFIETYLNIFAYPFFSVDASESEQLHFKKLFFNSMREDNPLELEQINLRFRFLIESITDNLNEDSYFMTNMSSQQNNNPNCYIATMAYQDINHPNVEFLRNYRDLYLVKSSTGKLFVELYYEYSPIIVNYLKYYPKINKYVRYILDVLIKILLKISFNKN